MDMKAGEKPPCVCWPRLTVTGKEKKLGIHITRLRVLCALGLEIRLRAILHTVTEEEWRASCSWQQPFEADCRFH